MFYKKTLLYIIPLILITLLFPLIFSQYLNIINHVFTVNISIYKEYSLFQIFQNNLYTYSYITIIVIVLLLITAIYSFKNRKIKKNIGINFKEEDKSHGSNRFMTEQEIEEKFNLNEDSKTTILGKYKDKIVTLKPQNNLNQNVLIVGGSGSGKTSTFVLNDIFQRIQLGHSLIITDPKGEIYTETNKIAEKNNYIVKILNFNELVYSDRFNPLEFIETVSDSQIFADIIVDNTESGINNNGDAFWSKGEKNLLKALTLYMIEDILEKNGRNMSKLYKKIASEDINEIEQLFTHLEDDSSARLAYNIYAKSLPSVKSSILTGLGVRLQIFQDALVRALTSKSDIDLTLPSEQKCIYYLITSDMNKTYDFLIGLFYSFLFIRLIGNADKQINGQCKVPVRIILDEFANICPIDAFEKKISTIRSRLISVVLIIQNIPQIQSRYPNSWEEIIR